MTKWTFMLSWVEHEKSYKMSRLGCTTMGSQVWIPALPLFTFMEIDHEIISTVDLLIVLIQEEQLLLAKYVYK